MKGKKEEIEEITCVQVRRIRCEHCAEAFAYWDSATLPAKPVLIRGFALRRDRGTAPCPHCGRLQSFMNDKRKSFRRRGGVEFGVGCILIPVVLVFLTVAVLAGDLETFVEMVLIAGGLLLMYFQFGWRSMKVTGRPIAAKGDLDLNDWIRNCEEKHLDPILAGWHPTLRSKRLRIFSLGIMDVAGDGQFPERYRTEALTTSQNF